MLCALQVLSKKKLQDLVREIDPNEQLDEDVEEVITSLSKLIILLYIVKIFCLFSY